MKTLEELKNEISELKGNKSRIGIVPFSLRADIAAYFHDADISQKQLSKELGLSGTTISNVVYPREKKKYVRKPKSKKKSERIPSWIKVELNDLNKRVHALDHKVDDNFTQLNDQTQMNRNNIQVLNNNMDRRFVSLSKSSQLLFWSSLVVSFIAVGISLATMVIQ